MKKIIFSLLIVFLIICGSFAALWWVKSNHFERAVASAIARQNAEYPGLEIQYEKLERSGFPFFIEVDIKNPRLTLQNSEHHSNKPSQITVDGKLTLGIPFFKRNQAWFSSSGNTHFVGFCPQEDKEDHWLLSGSLQTKFEFSHPFFLDELPTQTLRTQLEDYLKEFFSLFSLQANHLTLSDALFDPPSKRFSLNKGSFAFNQAKKGIDSNDFNLKLNLEGFEYEDIDLANKYKKLFPLCFKDEAKVCLPTKLHTADLILEARSTFPPIDLSFFRDFSLQHLPPFFFAIDRYEMSEKSSLGTSLNKGRMTVEKKQDKFLIGDMAFEGISKFSDKQHQELVDLFELITKQLLKEGSPVLKNEDHVKFLKEHQRELKELIPNFSEFGTITSQLDGHFHGLVEESSPPLEKAFLELRKGSLASDLYGVAVTGKLKEEEWPNFNGELTIQLLNYQLLLQDMANYYNRYYNLLTSSGLISKEKLPSVSAQYVGRVTHFLESLALDQKKQANQLVLPLTLRNSHLVDIGPLTLQEFIMGLRQLHREMPPHAISDALEYSGPQCQDRKKARKLKCFPLKKLNKTLLLHLFAMFVSWQPHLRRR